MKRSFLVMLFFILFIPFTAIAALSDAEVAAINQQFQHNMTLLNSGNIDEYMDAWATDRVSTVVDPDGHRLLLGKDAIKAYLQSHLQGASSSINIENIQVSETSDPSIVWVSGTVKTTYIAANNIRAVRESWVAVHLIKQGDLWKVTTVVYPLRN